VKYSQLSRTHADVEPVALQRYQDLFVGGEAFRRRIDRYLVRNDLEPPRVFAMRCERAHYLNYVARIIRYFAAALFQRPLTFTCDGGADDWYLAVFKEDCDGAGTDLDVALKDAFVRALVGGRAYVRIQAPDLEGPAPATLAEAERSGARRMTLAKVPTENVTHWKRAEDGSFEWVMEHACEAELHDPADAELTVTETWTAWYADGTARRWRSVRSASRKMRKEDDVPEVEAPRSPCGAIPIVELRLPPELHLLAHIADPALEAFRKANALSWAVDRTCYAMPVFHLKDGAKSPPVMGAGYYLMIGVDEKVDWPTPPSAPFDVVKGLVQSLVQEIHRVVEQMALAVDNNAAAAVGRSGDSKDADGAATQTVLPSFGERVREFAEKALDLVAAARGDRLTWAVQGMDRFDLLGLLQLIEAALTSDPLQIPSPTHRRELMKSVSRALLPGLPEQVRTTIDGEIDRGVNAEDTDPAPGARRPVPAGDDPDPDPDPTR
jgi:hypothetical protein